MTIMAIKMIMIIMTIMIILTIMIIMTVMRAMMDVTMRMMRLGRISTKDCRVHPPTL